MSARQLFIPITILLFMPACDDANEASDKMATNQPQAGAPSGPQQGNMPGVVGTENANDRFDPGMATNPTPRPPTPVAPAPAGGTAQTPEPAMAGTPSQAPGPQDEEPSEPGGMASVMDDMMVALGGMEEDAEDAMGGPPNDMGGMASDGLAPEYTGSLIDACARECQKDIDCNGEDALYATANECRDATCRFLEGTPESVESQACVDTYVEFYDCLVTSTCGEYNEYWSENAMGDYPCIDEELAAQDACEPLGEGPIISE